MRNLMGTLGPAAESLRLAERYRQMSDDELIELAKDSSELTELAQGVLTQEVLVRKLKVPPVEEQERPQPELQPSKSEDEYAEDRSLIELCTVWSHNDAVKVATLLDAADIPFFMGPERATRVDRVTSSFSPGVAVNVMQIGLPWAREAIMNYVPVDAPPELKEDDAEEVEIHCPKCHSIDVVFEHLSDEPKNGNATPQKFDWTCASCGYAWEDDGVESKK